MPIAIPQPSMALNAEGIEDNHKYVDWKGFCRVYHMWNTWKVSGEISIDHLIDHVANVADGAPDHYLRVVVFNAHGSGAFLRIGRRIKDGDGLGEAQPSFERWRNRVANIWLMSCSMVNPKTYPVKDKPPEYNDGNLFCSALAKLTGAYVVASQDPQPLPLLPLPWGCVCDWEGRVFRYEPDHGSVDWHYNYPTSSVEATLGENHPPPPIAVPRQFRARQGGPGIFSRSFDPPQGPRPRPPTPRPGMRW